MPNFSGFLYSLPNILSGIVVSGKNCLIHFCLRPSLELTNEFVDGLHKFPAGIYLLKVKYRNTGTRCEICSKLIVITTTPLVTTTYFGNCETIHRDSLLFCAVIHVCKNVYVLDVYVWRVIKLSEQQIIQMFFFILIIKMFFFILITLFCRPM